MRDPFRPNSNSQLIREAQIAFVVIAALLCVLVYVAFHRMSGRKMHFRQIAQSAPVAQHIDDSAYPAQAMIDQEAQAVRQTLSTIKQLAEPGRSKIEVSPLAVSDPKNFTPPPQVIETLPVNEAAVAAAIPVVPSPSVAQTTYIESVATGGLKSPDATKDIVDPFENIRPTVPLVKPLSPKQQEDKMPLTVSQSTPLVPKDLRSPFTAPKIKSNFGTGSTRELSTLTKAAEDFESAPTRPALSPVAKLSHRPVAENFSVEGQVSDRQASKKLPKRILPPGSEPSFSSPPVVDAKTRNGDQYKVQSSDSLWSIATERYGDGRFFRALHQHNQNRIASTGRLEPETVILIPEVNVLLEQFPALCPKNRVNVTDADSRNRQLDYDGYESRMDDRFHITKAGDTLFDVARQRLGQASRYLEIFELNRFRIPEQINHLTPLKPGLRLLLPE